MVLPSGINTQHVGTFWMLPLDATTTGNVVPRVPATFQRIGPEATPLLTQAMERNDPAEVYQRFATGRCCYVALVDGKYAAYGWVSFDKEKIGEFGLHIRLASGEAYIWDCATLPTYRGQRLYPALLTYMISELRAEGLSRIWIGADADNVASQTGMALAGFQPIADIVIDCVLTLRRPWLRGRPGIPEQLVMDIRRAVFGDAADAWVTASSSVKQKESELTK